VAAQFVAGRGRRSWSGSSAAGGVEAGRPGAWAGSSPGQGRVLGAAEAASSAGLRARRSGCAPGGAVWGWERGERERDERRENRGGGR
jgi:hypothetical protein